MRRTNAYPLFCVGICCFAGVQLAQYIRYELGICMVIIIVISSLYSLLIKRNKPSKATETFRSILLVMGGLVLGLFLGKTIKPTPDTTVLEKYNCNQQEVIGILTSNLKPQSLYQNVTLSLLAVRENEAWIQEEGNILLSIRGSIAPMNPTDTLQVLGYMTNVYTPFFSYRQYLEREGIYYRLYVDTLAVKPSSAGSIALLEVIRSHLERFIGRKMDTDEASLANAVLLGNKKQLSKNLKNAFSKAGASHFLAISGMHVGLVFLVFWYTLSMLFSNRQRTLKAFILSVLIVLFAIFTGGSPSVVRASLLLSIVTMLKAYYVPFQLLNILGLVGILQLFLFPEIAFSLGFQLSYVAVIGLVVIFPYWRKIFHFSLMPIQFLADGIGVSLIASTATAPLVLYYFHVFPVHFIITNILIQLLGFIIVLSGLLMFLLESWSGISLGLTHLCEWSLGILIDSCQQISQWPYAQLSIQAFEPLVLGVLLFEIGFFILCLIAMDKLLSTVINRLKS